MSEYGRAGLVGVLPPQANPTVEAELSVLLEPDVAMAVSRLVCEHADARTRLVGYFHHAQAALRAFDTLRPAVALFACTGSSYLVGLEAEDAVFAPRNVISAARAVLAALDALEARRIALVSPYPAWLTEACVAFWSGQGREVVALHRLEGERADTRGIYALGSREARTALRRLEPANAQVVLISGTGMPTLAALAHDAGAPAVLSSNLCLAWAAMQKLRSAPLDGASLRPWLAPQAAWRARLAARFPSLMEPA